MAKVTLNPIFKDVRGKLGNHVFRRSSTGELSVTKVPDMSNVEWSEAQKAQRRRFKEAAAYAKAAMADPIARAYYEEQALQLHKRRYDLAVSDYFKGRNLLRNEQDVANFDPGI